MKVFDSYSTLTQDTLELELTQDNIRPNQKFTDKVCAYAKKGSISLTIISMLATTIGISMMWLPGCAKSSGILATLTMILISSIVSYTSMHMLSWASSEIGSESLSEIVKQTLGYSFKRIFELVIIVYCFGVCVSAQIAFPIFIIGFLKLLYPDQEHLDDWIVWIQLAYILPNLIISFQKQFYNFRYFTFLGIIGMISIALGMFVNLIVKSIRSNNEESTVGYQQAKLFQIDLGLFMTFSQIFYCFVNHHYLLPIMKELSNPTLKRKEKVIMKTIAIILIIYFMVATSGYLTFLDESEPLILINYEGVWSMIAKGIMTMTLFFGVPLTIFACRNVIQDMLVPDIDPIQPKQINVQYSIYHQGKLVMEVQDNDTRRDNIHIITTLVLQCTSAILAICFPSLGLNNIFLIYQRQVFSILGGIFGTTIVCIFPTMVYISLQKEHRFTTINILIIFLMLGVVIVGWTGAIMNNI